MREFHRPTFLNPEIKTVGERVNMLSAVVKGNFLQTAMADLKPGEEKKVHDFYIKEVPDVDYDNSLTLRGLPAYRDVDFVWFVSETLKSLHNQGKSGSAQDLIDYFDTEKNRGSLELQQGETVRSKIEKALALMEPETVLRNYQDLYEKHRSWYDHELPGFVIDKLFIVGADESQTKHGYILKTHVDSALDKKGREINLGEFYEKITQDGVVTTRSDSRDRLRNAQNDLVDRLKEVFPSRDQRVNLGNDLLKFVDITKRLISEDTVIDFGPGAKLANIRITPDAHLRMIDTGHVYRAKDIEGGLMFEAQVLKAVLDSLAIVARNLTA